MKRLFPLLLLTACSDLHYAEGISTDQLLYQDGFNRQVKELALEAIHEDQMSAKKVAKECERLSRCLDTHVRVYREVYNSYYGCYIFRNKKHIAVASCEDDK